MKHDEKIMQHLKDQLETFLSHAMVSDSRNEYNDWNCTCIMGAHSHMHCKRFRDSRAVGNPMVTFILVRMEEEDLCGGVARWEIMRHLGGSMWQFLKGQVPSLEHTRLLSCTTEPLMVMLLEDGGKVFLTAKCWDDSVTGQDGFEWIHASMYALAYAGGCPFPLHKVPLTSRWDIEMNTKYREHLQAMELAFAMGTHHRLGHSCLLLKFFTTDVMRLLHDLHFRTHWDNVSSEDAKKFILGNNA